jgi:hypothetical protein
MAVFAPMPTASVQTARSVKAGFLRKMRIECVMTKVYDKGSSRGFITKVHHEGS